jgi:TPP-dependent pyruvate/acetoin dehydrogenase alpha subunit
MSEEDMAREKRDIERELDEAVDFAKKSPWPKTEELLKDLYYSETLYKGTEQ